MTKTIPLVPLGHFIPSIPWRGGTMWGFDSITFLREFHEEIMLKNGVYCEKSWEATFFAQYFFWTCWQIKGMSSDDNSTFYRENIIWFLFCAHFVKIDSLHKSCPIRNFFLPEKKNVKAAMYSSLTLKLIQEKITS